MTPQLPHVAAALDAAAANRPDAELVFIGDDEADEERDCAGGEHLQPEHAPSSEDREAQQRQRPGQCQPEEDQPDQPQRGRKLQGSKGQA